ncbi:unnamed protein product, partial [Adineta ricciae]
PANSNEHEVCLTFVSHVLKELNDHLKHYEIELETIKASLMIDWTSTIQDRLETYIMNNLYSFRTKMFHQIELIYYDYHIQAIKLEYLRHNPSPYQKQLLEDLCQYKYELVTAEEVFKLLEQQINFYNSSNQSFEFSPIAESTLSSSIANQTLRQRLYLQYKETAAQARAQLFRLYLTTAEDDKYQCQ